MNTTPTPAASSVSVESEELELAIVKLREGLANPRIGKLPWKYGQGRIDGRLSPKGHIWSLDGKSFARNAVNALPLLLDEIDRLRSLAAPTPNPSPAAKSDEPDCPSCGPGYRIPFCEQCGPGAKSGEAEAVERDGFEVRLQMLGDGRFYDEQNGEWEMTQATYEERTKNCQCVPCVERRARAALTDPAPTGEAVSACNWPGCIGEGRQCSCDERADERLTRLREDLERVTRELAEVEGARASLEAALIDAERDDVRKALETARNEAAEDERDRLYEKIQAENFGLRGNLAINGFLRETGAMLPAERAAARSASREAIR